MSSLYLDLRLAYFSSIFLLDAFHVVGLGIGNDIFGDVSITGSIEGIQLTKIVLLSRTKYFHK